MKKLSRNLAARTRLTPDQLDRLKMSGNQGDHLKFATSGTQSLVLTKRLVAARKKCKKYVLQTTQLGRTIYIADWRIAKLAIGESPITFNKKEALVFALGMDDPETKIKYYNELTKLKLITHNV